MVWSCFQPAISWIPWAKGLSLATTHAIAASKSASRSHSSTRRLGRRERGVSGGSTSTTVSLLAALAFAGELTGLPHFGQNIAPSGRVSPHPLHPKRTAVGAAAALPTAVLTGCPHFRQKCEASGRLAAHLLHNTSGSLLRPWRKMSADISTRLRANYVQRNNVLCIKLYSDRDP